jgi:membrane-bound lytic murein transglycosylase B
MGKQRTSGGRHADRSKRRVRQLTRRASRMTVLSSLLLPMPVAMAVPQAVTLSEEVLGVTRLPATGVGDPARSHLAAAAAARRHGFGAAGPSVSVTRVEKLARSRQQVRAQASAIAANGIPAAALRAYRTAEATMNIADPSCGLSWGLLAGIGRIESDHGRYGGAVLADNGISTPRILGLPLNGTGAVSAIADTDHGTLDGDKKWDRAVGPMQFIPSTWAMVGVDGDGDGQRNPHDIDDAALAAAAYLCVGDNDLTTPAGMHDAVLSYNHSEDYVATVLGVAHAYQSGIVNLPLLTATLTLPTGPGTEVGLTPGHGIAIGATDDVSKVGPKKAKQARRGATDSTKGRTKDGTKAGDTKNDAKVGDRTQKPSGGGDQQKPPAGDGQGPVDDSTPRTGGGDKPTPTPEPKPTPEPNDPPSTGDNGGNGGGDETEPSPTPNPSPSPTPTPTPDPSQDVAEGTLVWCDEAAQDALCLDDAEHPLEVDVDSYKSLVDSPVTVIYGSTDGSLSGTICSIQPGKVDEPEC